MRKVFLDELPKKEGVGHLKGKMVIDWNNSVGYRVSFVYDDIEGEIEIVGYDKENMELEIKYNDKVVKSRCQNFSYARIGQLVKDPYDNFRCEIGQIFKDSKRHLVIIDREHKKTTRSKGVVNEKWYKYKCNICTYEGWIREVKLIRNQGCSCCNGQTIDPKINSIYAKAPWMMKYLVNKEDGYKYAPQSNKNLMVKCPDCGKEKEMDIGKLYTRKSIGCTCGDGISFPEKFMSNILSQLELEFMTQLTKTTFKWCDKYKYDFHIPSLNMIIETHGEQHYRDNTAFGKPLEKQQENDRIKRELALANGIEYYIELDCRKSELGYIKNNIFNSDLNKLLELTKIDWLKCEEFALSNIIKTTCNYWNNGYRYTVGLAKIIGVDRATIINYLKQGARLGWCDYDPKEEMQKSNCRTARNTEKIIKATLNDEFIGVFKGASNLARISEKVLGVKLSQSSISRTCRGEMKSYKGFNFEYI